MNIVDLAGTELGPSSWIDVTQERIDGFAAATGDSQWIHVDADRAAEGPFGTTIAHGFLTLSLVVPMLSEVLPPTAGMTINYGVDRVRAVAELAAELGADVPSQLDPGLAVGTGAGELVQRRAPLAPHAYLIVPLPHFLSAGEVYREADRLELPRDRGVRGRGRRAWIGGRPGGCASRRADRQRPRPGRRVAVPADRGRALGGG